MTEEELLPFCACGKCGLRVTKKGNRFIHGHHMRGIPRSPEHCAALAKAAKGVPRSPEACAAISKGKTGVPQTSPAQIAGHKLHGDKQRGGNDLVTHHYIYDESDLSLNTVQMTRSDHQRLHKLLQKLGYIIPHINVKEN